jgi:uncharacterized protein
LSGINNKYNKLKEILKSMGSVLVAFSGGVDSTLLLKVSADVLGDKAMAVIATSATYPSEEIGEAEKLAESFGVKYKTIETDELADERFLCNPKERCYYCKQELFSKLIEIARGEGLKAVVDGSNIDDASDFRPGSKAKAELGVRSPLAEADFSKDDIRELSKQLGLVTWNKPSFACLSSRVPYGTRITNDVLKMVGEAEKFIRGLGFREVRVRHHDYIARIEVGEGEIAKVVGGDLMGKITKKLEGLGYLYVTVDLKGYRTGSMNEVLEERN